MTLQGEVSVGWGDQKRLQRNVVPDVGLLICIGFGWAKQRDSTFQASLKT